MYKHGDPLACSAYKFISPQPRSRTTPANYGSPILHPPPPEKTILTLGTSKQVAPSYGVPSRPPHQSRRILTAQPQVLPGNHIASCCCRLCKKPAAASCPVFGHDKHFKALQSVQKLGVLVQLQNCTFFGKHFKSCPKCKMEGDSFNLEGG